MSYFIYMINDFPPFILEELRCSDVCDVEQDDGARIYLKNSLIWRVGINQGQYEGNSFSFHTPASILHMNPFLSSHGVKCHIPSGILRTTHGCGLRWSMSGFRRPQLDCSVGVPSNHLKVLSVGKKMLACYE